MKRKRKRKKGFYRILADLIVEGAPFDVSKNGGGYTTVQELINLYRLRELSDANRMKMWNESLEAIKGVFWVAIHYINDNPDNLPEFRNVHSLIYKPVNKRNIEFLSISFGYRQAKKRNTDRLIRRIETVVRPAIKEIRKIQPERLKESREKTTKLLLGDTSATVKVKS